MTFITIFVALLIERFFDWGHVRLWGWFPRFQHWLDARFPKWPGYVLLMVALLPALLIAFAAGPVFGNTLFGIVRFLFNLLILMYCIGPQNLWAQTYAAIKAQDPEQFKQLTKA